MKIFKNIKFYIVVCLISLIWGINMNLTNKDKISNLGWENLLHLNFERYYPLCCFDCLSYPTKKKFLYKLDPR